MSIFLPLKRLLDAAKRTEELDRVDNTSDQDKIQDGPIAEALDGKIDTNATNEEIIKILEGFQGMLTVKAVSEDSVTVFATSVEEFTKEVTVGDKTFTISAARIKYNY